MWQGDYCKTVEPSCLEGTYLSNNVCVAIPSQCPYTLIWDTTYKRCVPQGNSCPQGTYFNGYSCLPYRKCELGLIWSNENVQCVCPDTSHWNGKECVSCSGGQNYGFNGCFCPQGSFFNGTDCVNFNQHQCDSVEHSAYNGSACECLPGFESQF